MWSNYRFTLHKTNIAPRNGWLEDEISYWEGLLSGDPLFSGRVIWFNPNACKVDLTSWMFVAFKRQVFHLMQMGCVCVCVFFPKQVYLWGLCWYHYSRVVSLLQLCHIWNFWRWLKIALSENFTKTLAPTNSVRACQVVAALASCNSEIEAEAVIQREIEEPCR